VERSLENDCVLVIMAKAPRQGSVKTRLSPHLAPNTITELYSCLLQDTLQLADQLSNINVAIMCPEADVHDLRVLAGEDVSVVAQRGNGLAEGLTSVFAHFSAARTQRIIAFNSDSPHLPPSVLEDAFEMLRDHEVVVGPTHDGGYYLVGARSSHPTLFARDGMGTSSALETLLARTRALDLSVGFVEYFYDIDIVNDLTRLAEDLRHSPARAPRTAKWLRDWELAAADSMAESEEL
jgi:uncharacterized protein